MPEDIEAHVGTDGLALLPRARAVVKSPGVPREAPVVAAARARGVPVLGELELGWRLRANEFVAVTGTNGKTTTVELLGHLYREAGLPVVVAGNVGTALTGSWADIDAARHRRLRGELVPARGHARLRARGAVLLNVEADHLDRHGTLEDYLAAKLQIFARQGDHDVAVAPAGIAIEDLGGCARRVPFGPGGELDDRAGHLWWDGEPLIAHADIRLRGAHNRANAAAAAAIALARGRPRRRPRGAAHVRRRRAPAGGGGPRGRRALRQRLQGDERRLDARRAGRVRGLARAPHPRRPRQGAGLHARCAAPPRTPTSSVPTRRGSREEAGGERCGDLATAVARARAAARAGDVVLLSPACASLDQFADFEARGRAFRALVA